MTFQRTRRLVAKSPIPPPSPRTAHKSDTRTANHGRVAGISIHSLCIDHADLENLDALAANLGLGEFPAELKWQMICVFLARECKFPPFNAQRRHGRKKLWTGRTLEALFFTVENYRQIGFTSVQAFDAIALSGLFPPMDVSSFDRRFKDAQRHVRENAHILGPVADIASRRKALRRKPAAKEVAEQFLKRLRATHGVSASRDTLSANPARHKKSNPAT